MMRRTNSRPRAWPVQRPGAHLPQEGGRILGIAHHPSSSSSVGANLSVTGVRAAVAIIIIIIIIIAVDAFDTNAGGGYSDDIIILIWMIRGRGSGGGTCKSGGGRGTQKAQIV